MRIFVSRWFDRYAKKNDISDKMLKEAIKQISRGLVDANLGRGVIKQRLARPGEGKSKGYRVIIVLNIGEIAFFVYGFAKNDKENLRQDEEEGFRNMAGHLLSLSNGMIDRLLSKGDFREVGNYDEKIP